MTAAARLLHPLPVIALHSGQAAETAVDRWIALRQRCGVKSPSLRHEWLAILRRGLGHEPYCIEARQDDATVGLLPLCFLNTRLFGRFLVGLPYLNVGGVIAQDEFVAASLIDRAVQLADDLDVRYLELRHERRWSHPALNYDSTQKVHMRLALPTEEDELWRQLKPKVRNQIRKAEQNELAIEWGAHELLDDFFRVFAVNMRDLGTPVFSRRLFAAILDNFGADAEICVVRHRGEPCAAGVLVHGDGMAEVPSASSLRRLNHLNPNMLLYWSMLRRCIARRHSEFDFGRTTIGSNTHRFKAQWGAEPYPGVWQYYVRRGTVDDMRPDNPKLQRRIALWKKMPVWLTRLIGPYIIRGIP